MSCRGINASQKRSHEGKCNRSFLPYAVYAFPLNCCFQPLGQVPVQANPESLLIFEHKNLAVPPFFGLISIPLNFRPVQGAALEQWMPAPTLYLLVPVIFSQVTSEILSLLESQFEYE